MKKVIFKAWEKRFRKWKVAKDEEAFQARLKSDMSTISGNYNKELESLRSQLAEANSQIASDQTKMAQMQQNLKKTLMKGMYAMNMEAMSLMGDESQLELGSNMFQS